MVSLMLYLVYLLCVLSAGDGCGCFNLGLFGKLHNGLSRHDSYCYLLNPKTVHTVLAKPMTYKPYGVSLFVIFSAYFCLVHDSKKCFS